MRLTTMWLIVTDEVIRELGYQLKAELSGVQVWQCGQTTLICDAYTGQIYEIFSANEQIFTMECVKPYVPI